MASSAAHAAPMHDSKVDNVLDNIIAFMVQNKTSVSEMFNDEDFSSMLKDGTGKFILSRHDLRKRVGQWYTDNRQDSGVGRSASVIDLAESDDHTPLLKQDCLQALDA